MAQKKNILINIQTLFFLIHQNTLKTMPLRDQKKNQHHNNKKNINNVTMPQMKTKIENHAKSYSNIIIHIQSYPTVLYHGQCRNVTQIDPIQNLQRNQPYSIIPNH